ncbi:MAG TPA: bile acid:sodium symporter, partial [Pseudomonas sp.]|nr:bile acid:sodium symporter [Pseudomonas sp.]
VTRNKGWLKSVDQGSILLVIYVAFSGAVVEGLWQLVPLVHLLGLVLACCLLLAIVLWLTQFLA